jgi:hypothetical protein
VASSGVATQSTLATAEKRGGHPPRAGWCDARSIYLYFLAAVAADLIVVVVRVQDRDEAQTLALERG